ncbi:O-antigen ligase family protein [Caldibacillus lycopersici]|uniref:O-antigen ligase family protein n=1 Tax=Perspicuibacillus lycopersici TaxID=1325689 RepID=A0AAE3IT66_9BACI|nr:O-antigen ligase family protein [Perspicuibacillus lycopersici]MCU9613188.1 O-antigen ligase family protein [Perspicuibacillus lycopersici]
MTRVKIGSKIISVNYILLFFLLMPCFQPSSISVGYFGVFLARLYDASEFFLYVYAILAMIKRKLKMHRAMKLLIFSELWIFIATMINGAEILDSLHSMLLIICTLYVVYIFGENMKVVSKVLMLHVELCIYINVLTLIVFPDRMYGFKSIAYGLSSEWFLGYNTNFLLWLFPATWIAILYGNVTKNWRRSLALIIGCIINLVIKGSSTALIGVAIILILYFLPFLRKVINPKIMLGFSLAGMLMIVFFTKYLQMFNWLIVGVLGKDLTFSNRVIIWENAINLISKNWLVGYGVIEQGELAGLLGMYSATHSHNFYLQLVLNGGVISLILFVGAQVYLIKCLRKYNKHGIVALMVIAMVAFNIISSTEILNYPQIIILFSVASRISRECQLLGETYFNPLKFR